MGTFDSITSLPNLERLSIVNFKAQSTNNRRQNNMNKRVSEMYRNRWAKLFHTLGRNIKVLGISDQAFMSIPVWNF